MGNWGARFGSHSNSYVNQSERSHCIPYVNLAMTESLIHLLRPNLSPDHNERELKTSEPYDSLDQVQHTLNLVLPLSWEPVV